LPQMAFPVSPAWRLTMAPANPAGDRFGYAAL